MNEELLDEAANFTDEEVSEAPVPLTDEEVLSQVKEDLEIARRAKDGIEEKIQVWKDLY